MNKFCSGNMLRLTFDVFDSICLFYLLLKLDVSCRDFIRTYTAPHFLRQLELSQSFSAHPLVDAVKLCCFLTREVD